MPIDDGNGNGRMATLTLMIVLGLVVLACGAVLVALIVSS